MKDKTTSICYVHTCALSSSSCAFTFLFVFHTVFVKGMPFGARHGRMPQPVLTCALVVVQLATSVDAEFDGGT
jgi:hypothetical protein